MAKRNPMRRQSRTKNACFPPTCVWLVPTVRVRQYFENTFFLFGKRRCKADRDNPNRAVGSGNPHNVDSFRRGKRYTDQGKAMAYVGPPKTAGKIVLTASADGFRSATLELTVRQLYFYKKRGPSAGTNCADSY